MSNSAAPSPNSAVDRFLRERPDAAFIAPFIVYLALMAARSLLESLLGQTMADQWYWLLTIARGVAPWLVFWRVRRYLPALGKPDVLLALVFGALAAFGWYYGQHLVNWLGLPAGPPFLFDRVQKIVDPTQDFGPEPWRIWATIILRVAVATITVPMVEELFWRGFLLRALIDWDRWQGIPLGAPSWRANWTSALLSILQHPYNWIVSVPCWLLFNGLMFWRKSLLFMMIVHGVTNLVLYVWAYSRGDWLFW